jgi:AcrR family transcriptional regulator
MASDGAATRQLLVLAAAPRFRRFGFRHTSVESITTAAGTGKGSLYLHYASKEELYLDTVRQAVDAFVAVAQQAIARERSAPARLRVLVETAVAHYTEDELLAAPLLGDDELLGARVAAMARGLQRERITELIEDTLVSGQRQSTIRDGIDPGVTAAVMFEIGWAIVRSHLSGELPVPLPDALHVLNDLLGRGTSVVARRPAR